jgi:hypothetical protein
MLNAPWGGMKNGCLGHAHHRHHFLFRNFRLHLESSEEAQAMIGREFTIDGSPAFVHGKRAQRKL